MSTVSGRRCLILVAATVLLTVSPAAPQTVPRPPAARSSPRLEAVAETKLLMEGLNQANFRGLERLLKQKPADVEAWAFARGQALLIAETSNLLMLRPPRNQGETVWLERSVELREAATGLARLAAARDYEASRAALGTVAGACNRCHDTFRVPLRIVPFAAGPERKVHRIPSPPAGGNLTIPVPPARFSLDSGQD
jgi:cytochrome c556